MRENITQVFLFSFWNIISTVDLWLFRLINESWVHPWLDLIFAHTRETIFWFPLYTFIFLYVVLKFGKWGVLWIIAFFVVAACCDIISTELIKSLAGRVRPCQDEALAARLRFIILNCPQNSSFTSSHATTHFAQATFFYLTLRQTGRWWGMAFIWAFLIAYGQVYVGVHYPFDVFCGAILGCLIGFAISRFFRKHYSVPSLDKQKNK